VKRYHLFYAILHHHHHHHHHRFPLCATIYPADLRPANEFFHPKVQSLVDELDKRYQRVRQKYSYVLEYFGEESTMKSQDFFTSLYKFIQEFSIVRDRIDRVKRAETNVK